MRIVLLASLLFSTAAAAQDVGQIDKRVGRLESEMRAVQRKVFPGGDPKYFEPEIAPAQAPPPAPVGSPASQPLVDLTERVGELERQLRTLTGQVEANQFKMRQLEEAQAKLRGDVEFRLTALEGGGAGAAAATTPDAPAKPAAKTAKADAAEKPAADKPELRPEPRPDPRPAPKAATADAAWKAAYAEAIAKDWPGTVSAMTAFIADWPKSTRIPQAQYWLGRANAEQGQNAEAARAYLEVYKNAPKSDRAPDSLIGLAGAMNALKKPKDACKVLSELDSVYGEKLSAGQQAEAKTLKTKAKCAA
jgi:tol-pal system protein YbgF